MSVINQVLNRAKLNWTWTRWECLWIFEVEDGKERGKWRKRVCRGELGMYMYKYTRKEGCNDGQELGRVGGWGKMEILGFNDRQYEQVHGLQLGGTCRFCRWACTSPGNRGKVWP